MKKIIRDFFVLVLLFSVSVSTVIPAHATEAVPTPEQIERVAVPSSCINCGSVGTVFYAGIVKWDVGTYYYCERMYQCSTCGYCTYAFDHAESKG